MIAKDNGKLRTFATGATRDTSERKLDPFGFISPVALHRFSEYMDKHRVQSDGNLRASDNWKKGMPKEEYVRSLIRHVMDFWLVTSGEVPQYDPKVSDPIEIACAIMFNVQGYLHEAGTIRDTVGQQWGDQPCLPRWPANWDQYEAIRKELMTAVDATFPTQ